MTDCLGDFASENGYAYHFEGNKLTYADGERIDLSLSLTCRQVAHELAGRAFEVNQITFRTLFRIHMAKVSFNFGLHADI